MQDARVILAAALLSVMLTSFIVENVSRQHSLTSVFIPSFRPLALPQMHSAQKDFSGDFLIAFEFHLLILSENCSVEAESVIPTCPASSQ